MTSISETRKRAWITRREKYGPIGHRGSYSRNPGPCPDCARMRGWLVRLHVEGTLSEGQAAKATGLGRIDLRKAADDLINSGAVRDTRGES
ncbi:hypothetical protein [Rhizobium lusitanum]|uniref:Uncharacterized protein n=1 Tax=Rhizobium lusitanum TaxID=293958 RepID=A0A1C3VSB6_9HYPH|nr:hypothetical protein [Rhizobium lusitanum]SCB30681.1 hypothetical protein GA0061101_106141 [Rhizobium lusitanum]